MLNAAMHTGNAIGGDPDLSCGSPKNLHTSIKCNRVAPPSIRVAPAFILVHFFSEGPLKRRNSLNTHISRNSAHLPYGAPPSPQPDQLPPLPLPMYHNGNPRR